MQNNGGWLVGGGSPTSPPHVLIGLSSPVRQLAGILVTAGHRQPGHQSQVGVGWPWDHTSYQHLLTTHFLIHQSKIQVLFHSCAQLYCGVLVGPAGTTGTGATTTIHNGSMTFLLSVAALQTANMTMTDSLVCELQKHDWHTLVC